MFMTINNYMQLLKQKYRGNVCLQSCESPVLKEYIVVYKTNSSDKIKWHITLENMLKSSVFCHVLLIN